MPTEQLIYDAWTPLTFKRQMGARSSTGAGAGFAPADWVGPEHTRRLTAYAILRSYQDNAAREFMVTQDRGDIDNRREYGEAALIVNTVLGALLGEDQTIAVDGAEDAEGPDGKAGPPEALAALALQEWLQQWAKDERLGLKMIETERRAIGLGDGVYTLGWSPGKGRPRLRVWDPAFYYPVLSDGNEDDFPDKVHIAWELPPEECPPGKKVIRRITWQLGGIVPANQLELEENSYAEPELVAGDALDEAGAGIVRSYPWNDQPSNVTCYLTDARWTLDTAAKSVDDLTEASAEYMYDEDGPVNRRDLGIDFMPVVHLPNTVSLIEHYGRSVLSTVLQILDDLASADTDLAAASATTGHPVIALQGGLVEKDGNGRAKVSYRPGEILESGEGKLSILDTSSALKALIEYIEFLLRRLSVNSRVAESLLGRVKASEVPSGIALALSFGPTEALVKEMRLVRDEKYPLLLKFAHRIALAAGDADAPPETGHARVEFGSFLPQDQQAAVTQVTSLLAAKPRPAISLETAVGILLEAGFPIKDALAEVERIQSRDFEGASELLSATGDQALAYEYLGREPSAEKKAEDALPPAPPEQQLGPDGQPLPPAPQPAQP